MAVVLLGNKGKEYHLPNEEDLRAFEKAKEILKSKWDSLIAENLIPTEKMALHTIRAAKYLEQWCRLLNPRQLLLMATLTKLIREKVREIAENEGYDFAIALGSYLCMLIGKHLNRNCRLALWDAAGEKVSFLDPAAYGVRFVANSVVTSQRMIQKHPDTVQKFARALLSGWEAALDPENRQKALETIHRFDQNTPVDLIGEQWDVTRKLVKPTDDIRIGTIDIRAWQQTEKIMLTQGRIKAPVYVENCLEPCVQ